ncbi:MAG TPA: MnhB domain-containing protein [Gemmatimonadaceae bacterium]|nr:MnhB domain-containing protein [Gemmatimonadaceae bacterium]HRQ78907.1 MnhB domain-containing protein [Gemmatimonadaceae bacterium]
MIRPFNSLMLRLLMSLLRGSIALFGVYVVLHGHYAPGGGFVAGALFAAAMILPRLLADGAADPWMLAPRGALVLAASGILLIATVAALPLLGGAVLFDYAALPLAGAAAERRSTAAMFLEVGVAMAVAGSMLSIYLSLTGAEGEAS